MPTSSKKGRDQSIRHSQGQQIIAINWRLLFQRLRARLSRLWKSASHQASQVEYEPPKWFSGFRTMRIGGFKITWFRVGLIFLLVYVLTNKQIDFTVSVGEAGISAGKKPATAAKKPKAKVSPAQTAQLGVWPASEQGATPASWDVTKLPREAVDSYIKRFRQVAQTEAEKFGIPVAAKLAIAILESEAGTHPRTLENNNHFGHATPNGYYPSAWANWRAHSEMMQAEYSQLANYSQNLQRWLKELDNSGYSEDSQYGSKLMDIIRYFDLE